MRKFVLAALRGAFGVRSLQRRFFGFLLLLGGVAGIAAEPQPRVFSVSPGVLPQMKARVLARDTTLLPAFRKLVNDANRALEIKPPSVMEKPRAGASGDKHDFLSQAPYFWPDPAKPDGLPYIRRDGHRNPESGDEHSDAPRMGRMANAAGTLAFAYYFSGDERYAAHAARVLRVWFLNPGTRMNPNFDQAQAIPGVNNGRGIGMIESRSLMEVCDAVGLLAGSRNWTPADSAAMQKWMREFLDWTQTSKNGRDERAAKNNHGSWYDAQVTHLALFTGETNLAWRIVESAKTNRIAVQFKPDGSQPLELAREDSFGYSRFNLSALFTLATRAEHLGVDLWHFEATNGASLKRGLDFLLPYAEQPAKEWPYQHAKNEKHAFDDFMLRKSVAVYHDDRLLRLLNKDAAAKNAREVLLIPLK